MIGLLVPSIANPFFGSLAREIEAVANERGYGVMLCNTQREADRELAYAQALMAQGVRGVVIGSALQAQEHLAPLIERGLAVVSFDRTAQEAPWNMDYVSVDNHRCGELAAEHLLALGHRDIVYVTAPLRSVSRGARLEGVRKACTAAGARLHVHIGDIPNGQIEMEMAALGPQRRDRAASRPARGHRLHRHERHDGRGLALGLAPVQQTRATRHLRHGHRRPVSRQLPEPGPELGAAAHARASPRPLSSVCWPA